MITSLWSSASGMISQQYNVDTIANNIANINTTGFKKNRADFEDLLYQNQRLAGTPATEQTLRPVSMQVGTGSKLSSTQKDFAQGIPQATGGVYDVAIMGKGFFRILNVDGTYGYSRDGGFKIDAQRQLVTANGNRVIPEIIFPESFMTDTIAVNKDGLVTVKVPNSDESIEVGQLMLYRFINPVGLTAIGENVFIENPASGEAIAGVPTENGMGSIMHKFLERSNVQAAEELVNLIVAQRAYEFNSKAVQTADSLLATATNLKR